MRLYIDEDAMAGGLTAALRSRDFDVETAEELGMRGTSDEDHLRYAASVGRTLYSFNRRDYLRIHNEWLALGQSHAGILLLGHRRNDIGHQLRGLMDVAASRGQAGMVNYLYVIPRLPRELS